MSNFAFKHWNTWQSYLLSRMILPQRTSGQCLQRMNLWLRNPCHFYVTWNLKGLSLSKVCMWRHQIIPEWHDVMLYRCWYWWQMDADFTLVFVSACIKINIASIHKHCLHHPSLLVLLCNNDFCFYFREMSKCSAHANSWLTEAREDNSFSGRFLQSLIVGYQRNNQHAKNIFELGNIL